MTNMSNMSNMANMPNMNMMNMSNMANMNMMNMCCGFMDCSQALPADPLLAYAYVPIQCLDQVYSDCKGLERGTLFPELDKPYGVYGHEFNNCKEESNECCDKCGGGNDDNM